MNSTRVAAKYQILMSELRERRQKILGKDFKNLFFYSNLYLHLLRPCSETIFKIVRIVSENSGK